MFSMEKGTWLASFKRHIRQWLQLLGWDLTKNLAYDRMTSKILKSVLSPHSNSIDVGAHRGEILSQCLKYAPKGTHMAIEPLPHLALELKEKYGEEVRIINEAVSNQKGTTSFHYVTNAEAYSGIKKRTYDIKHPQVQRLEINTTTLDHLVPEQQRVDLVKIDVEGGEFEVLNGATRILAQQKPFLIFECGKGGLDQYGHHPKEVYALLQGHEYQIFTLKNWLKSGSALSGREFEELFFTGTEYYFVGQ